jgi:CRISPR-associated protein Cmr6
MRSALSELHGRRNGGSHPGLLLQKYLAAQEKPEERRALLVAVAKAASSESLQAIYSKAFDRWVRSFSDDFPHCSERLAVAGRLIVGLGSESVLETGLRLHHTYGVPIIPGSALKGLASHYCDEVWGQRHDPACPDDNQGFRRGAKYHAFLFGKTEDAGAGRTGDAGAITFHDAWMLPETVGRSLYLDVMTPHHLNWQNEGASPPTDFDSPTPIPFLSVAGTFDVRVSWSGPRAVSSEEAKAWTALAMSLLHKALSEWGVGGKTSSGYGRLVAADAQQNGRQVSAAASPSTVTLPKSGDIVEAQLLEERTRNGGWKAKHAPSGLSGAIQNSNAVPPDKKPGDTITLAVVFANSREIAFRYPVGADELHASGRRGKKPVGPGRTARR